MTEQQILKSTLAWARLRCPQQAFFYHTQRDKETRRDIARELLRRRIEEEPSFIYCLPVDLLIRMNYAVKTDARILPAEIALAKKLGARIQGVMQ